MRAVPSALGSQHRLVWELSAVRSAFIPRSFKLGCWHLAAPAAAPNPSSQIPAPWPWPAPRCPDRDSCLHLRPRGSAAKYKWQAGARSHIRRGEREWEERPHQPRPQIHCLAASASHLQGWRWGSRISSKWMHQS
ncbi:hypothetical protein SEVIR_3G031233v4 [Setaria viridis]